MKAISVKKSTINVAFTRTCWVNVVRNVARIKVEKVKMYNPMNQENVTLRKLLLMENPILGSIKYMSSVGSIVISKAASIILFRLTNYIIFVCTQEI